MDHDFEYVLRNFWTPLLAFSLLIGVYFVWLGMALAWLAAAAKRRRSNQADQKP